VSIHARYLFKRDLYSNMNYKSDLTWPVRGSYNHLQIFSFFFPTLFGSLLEGIEHRDVIVSKIRRNILERRSLHMYTRSHTLLRESLGIN
jgi:hypothetical protein